MAGGAVVAAAAAAHAKRKQDILDAFRLAGATAPERARPLAELGLAPNGEVEEFIKEGILVSAPRAGAWYLSEAAYVTRRDARGPRVARIIVMVFAIAIVLAAFALAFFVSSKG
jgi:hypothetical protein